MKRIIIVGLATSTLAAMAFASDRSGTTVLDAETSAQITETLTAQGYDVQSIETEDDGYEVLALKDGVAWELELNAELTVQEVEPEDDD